MDIKLEFSFFLVYICVLNGIIANVIIIRPYYEPMLLDLKTFKADPIVVGRNLTLTCRMYSRKNKHYISKGYFEWKTPKPFDHFRMHVYNVGGMSTLTIYYILKSDSGTYGCSFGYNNYRYASLDVQVMNLNEDFLYMEVIGNTSKTVSTGQPSVEWIVTVMGHPDPKVEWMNNKYNVINLEYGSKYEMWHIENTFYLKIKNIDINDFGNFTFTATNGITKTKIFSLNVTGKPTAVLDVKPFYIINSVNTVKCLAFANPEPEIQWYSKPCLKCDYMPINGTDTTSEGYKYESALTINVTKSGYLKCFVRNHEGNSSDTKKFYVSDVENGFNIYSLDKDVNINKEVVTIIEGNTVTIICCASIYTYYGIQWFVNGIPLENSRAGYRFRNTTTQFSSKIELELQHANISNSGFYSCKVADKKGHIITLDKTFRVESPQVPKIINSSMQQDILFLKLHDKLELYCKCSGFPIPVLTWYKDGKSVQKTNNSSFENNEYLIIWNTTLLDAGTYKCEATNRLKSAFKQQTVQVLISESTKIDPQQTDHGWTGWLVSVVLGLVSIGVIIFIAIKIRKEKLLQRELKKLGLANFQKGAMKNINPGLGIGEQAELLPYYKKWEFPKERLQLGKQLGSGAFGVVMEGIAKNIVRGEDETKVAVKMVKRNADHTYIRILASELKIMVHLGKHLNVVNLLVACTKSVTKKELLIIVEYCRFGNLQNYLLRHRATFIDQIDPETGNIDYAIDQEFLECTSAESCGEGSNQPSSHSYAELSFSNNQIVEPLTDNGDHQTDTTVSEDETTSDSKLNSNFKENHKDNVTTICTKDLLSWSFQVARGMEYLAARKVLHGDLAARNILLAENNVVKICDFGLAKNMYMYTNVNYTKKGNSPLPVKWMAIESIRDRIFSTQSDVWSFGILLWEFFSMGETPYPGIEVDERLYQKLLEGYRMESPQFASREVYKLMTECWSHEPTGRLSFSTLAVELGCLLEDPVKQHYIDLNDPYLLMNTQQLKDQTDYLALLNPPTFDLLSTPHLTIDVIDQEASENDQQSMTGSIISCKSIKEGSTIDSSVNNLNSDKENAMKVSYTSKNEYVDL